VSQTYRCVLPITPWIYFLLDDKDSGHLSFSTLLLIAYVLFKVHAIITHIVITVRVHMKQMPTVLCPVPNRRGH